MLGKNKCKIIITAIFIAILSVSHMVHAETLEELQKELQEIKDSQMSVKEQYSSIEIDIALYEEQITELEEKITTYNSKINSIDVKITQSTEKVEELEKELQDMSVSYESTKDLLNTRLRALYENGFVNMWEVLFKSSSLLDFISKYTVLAQLIEYDTTKLKAMANQKEYLNNLKEDADITKTQVAQAKYDLEKTKEALEISKSNKQSTILSLEKTKLQLEAKQKELQELSAEIEEKYEKLRAEAGYSGDFIWPIRSYGYITSYYGYWRPDLQQFYGHSGIDIVGYGDKPYNKSYTGSYVRASCSGTVVSMFKETPRDQGNKNSKCPDTAQGANYTCGGVSSYGRYIKIYSATNGYSIVYGHLYEIMDGIEVGSYVTQGQIIGVMGTTGSSTGVHLHFEVRKSPGYYANAVDPLLIQSLVDSRNLYY